MTSASSLADDTELVNANESGATSDEWVKDLSESSESPRSEKQRNNNNDKAEALHERWEGLLGVRNRPDPLLNWDQLYNLQHQAQLRKDTRTMFHQLPKPPKIAAHEVESILTLYCKKRQLDYTEGNGWVEMVRILLSADFDPSTLFNVFYAITTKYIPRSSETNTKVYDLFRLILQYHDPELCSFLDTLKIQPQQYAADWFSSLMAKSLAPEVCKAVWDLYFQQGDPFLIFFIGLSILQCAKERLLALKERTAVLALIRAAPAGMTVEDVADLFDVCLVTLNYTPVSLRRDFHCVLFGANLLDEERRGRRADPEPEEGQPALGRVMCLPVSARELYKRVVDVRPAGPQPPFHYFVIDTRPHAEFAAGALLGAYNLSAALLVDDPASFQIAMTSLLHFKHTAHPKDHVLFVGAGEPDADARMFMVVARFLQNNIPHISFVDGGYKVVHAMLKEANNLNKLNNHLDPAKCSECNRKPSEHGGWSIMAKMKKAVQQQKEAIASAVSGMVESSSQHSLKHAKPSDRHTGKLYKNVQSVFTINNSESEESDDEDMATGIGQISQEKKKWSDVERQPDVYKHFEGHEVFADKSHQKCHVVVTYTHLQVYHHLPDGMVKLHSQHPLHSIVRVTSKKKVPEFLTFKFGFETPSGDTQVTRVQCFILGKSGDCAQAIKQVISSPAK